MRSVWRSWTQIRNKIISARRRLLIMDFDGTLADIAGSPDEVVFEKKNQDVLNRLSRLESYQLAVISGRSLENLTTFFCIKKMIYAGNHGLELSSDKFSLPAKARQARKLEALIWVMAEKLRVVFSEVPGLLIEDKGYTLSVHYRNMPRKHAFFFRRELQRFKKKFMDWPVYWKRGKMVWEIRPSIKWDKGDLALYLSKKYSKALPVVIGDDRTDEDMFRALKHRAITIRVGYSRTSRADYYLESPKAVTNFLERLSEL